ncbi:hypothetical protein MBLNU230_g8657t1 [Neophaeotheca triangularis]
MATLTETDLTRVSTETADNFAEEYYSALNGAKDTLTRFYLAPTTVPRPLPHVSYNGEVITDPAEIQMRFEKQMPYCFFEAESVNAHVLNPALEPLQGGSKKDAEMNMSLIVQVSGSVRLIERKEGPLRGFSDSFVLVPNREAATTNKKSWLIQTQNFRFVV